MSILHYENRPIKINILEKIEILKEHKWINIFNIIISMGEGEIDR